MIFYFIRNTLLNVRLLRSLFFVSLQYNCQTRLIMNKDFPFKKLNQSYMNPLSFQPNSPPSNSQSFYQSRPLANYSTLSPERMNHSFFGPSVSPPAQHFRQDQLLPSKQNETIRSCLQLQHKENGRLLSRQTGASFHQLNVFEQRMVQFERRVQRMQKKQKKSEALVKKVEEVMQLKLNDIKIIEDFEEKLAILDQMVRHLKHTKLDRKQLQNSQVLNSSFLQSEIKELWRQDELNKNDIKDSKQIIQRLVSNVESSVITIGHNYQEFIERNIIQSIEHVNKLTNHYHQQIQTFKSDFMKLKDKLEAVPLGKNFQQSAQTSLKMMVISIPNIKIVQSITITNEKKTGNFSLFAKQPKSTSSMASYKNNLFNNLYDFIDKSTQSSCAQLLLQKIIYKVDREFYLLDENDHYIIDAASNRVRLNNEHIKILEESGLIE